MIALIVYAIVFAVVTSFVLVLCAIIGGARSEK